MAQVEGAALWGLSMAVREGSEFVNGQPKDTNLNTYWGQQDPAAEIRASLAGQPAYDPTGLYYSSIPGTPKRLAERHAFLEVTSALEIEASRLHHHHSPPPGGGDTHHVPVKMPPG